MPDEAFRDIHNDGLIVEHKPDGIVWVTLSDLKRPTIDQFVTFFQLHNAACANANKVALRLIKSAILYPTPYAVNRVTTYSKLAPKNLHSYDAIIVPDTRMMLLVQRLVSLMLLASQAKVQLYTSQENALAWLEERRAANAEPSQPPQPPPPQ
jgi:hypothetical protein